MIRWIRFNSLFSWQDSDAALSPFRNIYIPHHPITNYSMDAFLHHLWGTASPIRCVQPSPGLGAFMPFIVDDTLAPGRLALALDSAALHNIDAGPRDGCDISHHPHQDMHGNNKLRIEFHSRHRGRWNPSASTGCHLVVDSTDGCSKDVCAG